jgi:hypothetical protein
MHLEVVSLKLILCMEGFLAILTSVPGMYFAIVLFPFHLTVERCAAFLTSIFVILILSHMIFSFQSFTFRNTKEHRCLGALFNERSQMMLSFSE